MRNDNYWLSHAEMHGGLGIIDPTRQCCEQYDSSVDVTAPFVEIIMEQKDTYMAMRLSSKRRKAKVKNKHRKEAEDEMNNLTLPESLGRAVELSNQKGSLNWLTSLPLECMPWFSTPQIKGHFVMPFA